MRLPDMDAPLTGCVTIDATAPDAYLDNARTGNRQASANNATEEAAGTPLTSETKRPAHDQEPSATPGFRKLALGQ